MSSVILLFLTVLATSAGETLKPANTEPAWYLTERFIMETIYSTLTTQQNNNTGIALGVGHRYRKGYQLSIFWTADI